MFANGLNPSSDDLQVTELRRSPASVTTLTALLEYRACNQAGDLAYRFLQDGEKDMCSVTYGELAARARAIATRLQQVSVQGDRALLLYGPGIEFVEAFWACALAGVIAVPISAARIRRDRALLQGVFDDAKPGLILGTRGILATSVFLSSHREILHRCILLNTDEVQDIGGYFESESICEGDLALLQYTSGSTASPKGVMVRHGNLLANSSTFYDGFALHDDSKILSWLPHFHDMGLIGKIIQAVYAGVPCILMASTAFIQKPSRWLTAISRYDVTISGAPNVAYDYCVSRIKDADMEGLDLSAWDMAFNGSEPVRAGTLDRFYDRFKKWGLKQTALYPCYGLAEATLFVSGAGKNKKPLIRDIDQSAFKRGVARPVEEGGEVYRIVSCGHAWGQERIRIVNPETCCALPEQMIGEIWIDGPSKTDGYWGKDELNESVFQAQISGESDGSYLRTGDLGFLQGDDLFITGRLKDVIICRGENYYPQDIEGLLEQTLPELKVGSGAAIGVSLDGEESLVIVYEVTRESFRNVDETVFKRVVSAVSDVFQLAVSDVVLVNPASIPKTTSGKIQRAKVKAAYQDGTLSILKGICGQGGSELVKEKEGGGKPQSAGDKRVRAEGKTNSQVTERVAAWIKHWMSQRLSVHISRIDTTEPFSAYGIDSVTAVELIEAVSDEYMLKGELEPTALWRYPNIDELVSYIMRISAEHVEQKTRLDGARDIDGSLGSVITHGLDSALGHRANAFRAVHRRPGGGQQS